MADNIYNFDERGFLIGMGSATKCTVTLESLRSSRVLGASQDGGHEFISILACICADTTFLPPTLIYQGKSNDLQSSWVKDVKEEEVAYFAATDSGWTKDALEVQWLKRVFDHHTKEKAGRGRRLLIIDGHSSHVNM